MSLLDDAAQATERAQRDADADAADADTDSQPQRRGRPSAGTRENTDDGDTSTDTRRDRPSSGVKGTLQTRAESVNIGGGTYTIESPETKQPSEDTGGWLTDSNINGIPRGMEAANLRNIAQTAAMQSIANGITDQLLGGELAFLDDEDAMDELSDAEREQVARLKEILRDVLIGPHMKDVYLEDLVVASVEDMLGPANSYWQLLQPETGDIPVVSLSGLDALTIRHNYDEHGYPQDPPYFQAMGAFGGQSGTTSLIEEPTPIKQGQIVKMNYPKGHRFYRHYPISAAWQVKEWLEILADSVTHHKRYYSDSEVPPGIMQVVNGTDATINDIQNQIEQAAGDPRDFPIVGGEAPAQWVEMGGTAINLDVIQEQQWFFQMCLGALGLNKSEVGLIEDVNYSNGEIQAELVYKKVAGPFGKQFERAFVEIAEKFDAYNDLGKPFRPAFAHNDPRAERAKQERLRQEYEAGKINLREYRRQSADGDLADDEQEFTVTLDGETIDYGDHPKWVAQRLLSAAGATEPDDEPTVGGDGTPDGESETDGEENV